MLHRLLGLRQARPGVGAEVAEPRRDARQLLEEAGEEDPALKLARGNGGDAAADLLGDDIADGGSLDAGKVGGRGRESRKRGAGNRGVGAALVMGIVVSGAGLQEGGGADEGANMVGTEWGRHDVYESRDAMGMTGRFWALKGVGYRP